jgi:penicillin amidase
MRKPVLALTATLAAVAAAIAPASSAGTSIDHLRAGNAVPPGESGTTTLPDFLAASTGASGSYGPHTDDQRVLYASWHYKPMQFAANGWRNAPGAAPPGDANVHIARDATYGVPTITAPSESDLFYGIGYAMATDRLFQMEVFRHVGHGTLAELTGPSGLPMDEAVRRVSEGDAALQHEFDALPAADRERLLRFGDGINARIREVGERPDLMPAEFVLLGDQPIKPWTTLDSLAFGEYAGRFFGEFGHGELAAATTWSHLVARYGQAKGTRLFDDALPLDTPGAPTTIAASDGAFPRHTAPPVGSARWVNHSRADVPSDATARQVSAAEAQVHVLQRELALPRFGSNAVVVSPRLTRDHHALLYGGPQTGWAVPGFFWEAEVHDPVRDQRGVMVPAIPLFVIGRNAHAAWTVTSALDANADTFVDQLDRSNATYRHDGRTLKVAKHTETLHCNNPPTDVLGLTSAQAPPLCPVPDETITVYRTVHGPALADPDGAHRLFTRSSAIDGRLLRSLTAWDTAGLQHDPVHFARAIAGMSLGFNFHYVDDRGHIGYWHTGRYPIRPRNVDPRLPIPGDGRFDWRGFERFADQPHVVDPSTGFVANWNNKPAVGWWSKNLESGADGALWGDGDQVQDLQAAVRARLPLTYARMGIVPRDVAYTDNRARYLKPYLLRALRGTSDPTLRAMRGYLQRWNDQRNVVDGKGHYGTPAVVFFDRWVEQALRVVEQPVLHGDWWSLAGLECATCHFRSVDNLAAPTYKFEYAGEQLLLAALRGQTAGRWRADDAALLQAARAAASQLAHEQGSDASAWNEPVETGEFSPQGGISVAPLDPLPNRGSYAQLVEATG